jgi:AraC-like DNA-binding protein
MEIIRLHAESFLKYRSSQASIIEDPKQLAILHCHDYFEIFIVNQGNAIHNINGVNQKLSPGMLYFIRPDDIHAYLKPSLHFQIVNIIVPNETFKFFLNFVGNNYYGQRLLSPTLPPYAVLTHNELESLMESLRQLLVRSRIMKSASDTLFRIAIFNLLTTYFPIIPSKNSVPIPDWLTVVSIEMLKKPNFTEGLTALYRLSDKSIEHVSRSCRKYLNKTPSQLVNEIRLEYAAHCLIETDASIVDICTDIGFDSLSYFYHLFQAYYGVTPRQLRKNGADSFQKIRKDNQFEFQDSQLENAVPLQKIIGNIPG